MPAGRPSKCRPESTQRTSCPLPSHLLEASGRYKSLDQQPVVATDGELLGHPSQSVHGNGAPSETTDSGFPKRPTRQLAIVMSRSSMSGEHSRAPLGRCDTKEAVIAVLGDDLLGPDGDGDEAGAGERDAERQDRGGDCCGLHVDWEVSVSRRRTCGVVTSCVPQYYWKIRLGRFEAIQTSCRLWKRRERAVSRLREDQSLDCNNITRRPGWRHRKRYLMAKTTAKLTMEWFGAVRGGKHLKLDA
ncbi:hypothetical protein BT67DRAFT_199020 [Trichocladium antarcticum]|uniref:Uncharacterized protein n=1 Tax=Trichocladium antarcticum TaxID=1450529 RepID=A0AAN6UQU5_9PEZI|nr:hypothetical protein BT67DRAFT_199020 [Trichocladium antarcticum]